MREHSAEIGRGLKSLGKGLESLDWCSPDSCCFLLLRAAFGEPHRVPIGFKKIKRKMIVVPLVEFLSASSVKSGEKHMGTNPKVLLQARPMLWHILGGVDAAMVVCKRFSPQVRPMTAK